LRPDYLLIRVVPTRVGVNRSAISLSIFIFCRPHTRGGEPPGRDHEFSMIYVVPTRVGVNRLPPNPSAASARRPHTRGGEPRAKQTEYFMARSSPHAWG